MEEVVRILQHLPKGQQIPEQVRNLEYYKVSCLEQEYSSKAGIAWMQFNCMPCNYAFICHFDCYYCGRKFHDSLQSQKQGTLIVRLTCQHKV